MFRDESERQRAFPVCARQIFLAHAAVTALPRAVAQAEIDYVTRATEGEMDYAWVAGEIRKIRSLCAEFLPGSSAEEIALLGPTALGLSLFAGGLDWQAGDEVVYHADCYPANVYPWIELGRRGVQPVALRTERYGEVTWEVVERALTPRTRLVALASAHFLTGYRIDTEDIGRRLHERGILFSVDAIQTVGAFPLDVTHVDFLSADAHKWMLGPLAIGIVMIKRAHFERLRPILLGAANVRCPEFIAQSELVFPDRAERYEPGVLNVAPMFGMRAGLELLREQGVPQIGERILHLKRELMAGLGPLGFEPISPVDGPQAAGMLTLRHPSADPSAVYKACKAANIIPSLRSDRAGNKYLRFSPHFYNTEAEMARVVEVVGAAMKD